MKDYSKVVDCLAYTAFYKDFDGSVEGWQKSYFELLSWKNTWDLCYSLDIKSVKDNGACLSLFVKKTKHMEEKMPEALKELGYRNIHAIEIKARIFDPYDIWPDDFDNEIYEYFEG